MSGLRLLRLRDAVEHSCIGSSALSMGACLALELVNHTSSIEGMGPFAAAEPAQQWGWQGRQPYRTRVICKFMHGARPKLYAQHAKL